jgi:hypothetical protein
LQSRCVAGVESGLISLTIFESWLNCLVFDYGFNKVGDRVREGVFVASEYAGGTFLAAFSASSVLASFS